MGDDLSGKLLDLGPEVGLDLKWFQEHVDRRIVELEPIDKKDLIFGRMATIFKVNLGVNVEESGTCKGDEEEGAEVEGSHANQNKIQNRNKMEKKRVVVKRVVPSELSETRTDLQVFLASARKEVEFYQNEICDENRLFFPKVFGSYERKDPENPGFLIVMEDCTDLGYKHIRSLNSIDGIKSVLDALVHLSSGKQARKSIKWFQTKESKTDESIDKERGGFWVLRKRGDDEIKNAKENWDTFTEKFKDVLETRSEKVLDLGTNLSDYATKMDNVARKFSCSLIHGDAKSWNVFVNFPEPTKLIDLQWVGFGHPLQDFVYFMTTSVGDASKFWNEALEYFYSKLQTILERDFQPLVGNDGSFSSSEFSSFKEALLCSDFETFKMLADVLWLDYCRVICLGLWKRLDPEKQKLNADKIGISLTTSSTEKMNWIVEQSIKLMPEIPDSLDKLLGKKTRI